MTFIVPVVLLPASSPFSVLALGRPVCHAPQFIALRIGSIGNAIDEGIGSC